MKRLLLLLHIAVQVLAKFSNTSAFSELTQPILQANITYYTDWVSCRIRHTLDTAMDEIYEFLNEPPEPCFWNRFKKGHIIKGAFLVFAEESQLSDIIYTITSIDSKLDYPWVFLHETPLTSAFKFAIQAIIQNEVKFGFFEQISRKLPTNVIQNAVSYNKKKWEPYRPLDTVMHMRQLYAGLFADHPLLKDIDYIWRVRFIILKID
jgi:hypothetical protein